MRCCVTLIVVASLLSSMSCGCTKAATPKPDWRSKQEIWWNDVDLVKQAIVSYLSFVDKNPGLHQASPPHWEITSLVLILEPRGDPRSLEALADLASYRLGASGGELFDCVVLRKGTLIAPQLRRRLEEGKNDCQALLGSESAGCRTTDDLRSYLKRMLEAVARNEGCHVEK